jgi:hypothetical protein
MKKHKPIRSKLKRINGIKKILLVEYALFIALSICLADLTAQFVANKVYPTPEIPAVIRPEKDKTIAEHICLATNGENCDVLINLARCESSLNKEAYHVNTNGTVDLGLFQINSIHKDITPSEKLDVYASARWSNEQIKAGHGSIWVCWDKI